MDPLQLLCDMHHQWPMKSRHKDFSNFTFCALFRRSRNTTSSGRYWVKPYITAYDPPPPPPLKSLATLSLATAGFLTRVVLGTTNKSLTHSGKYAFSTVNSEKIALA